jgi:hypothetical protein
VLTLTPPWTNVPEAVGGGPLIVRDGRPVYRAFENFTSEQLAFRNGRSAVGQTADGRIVFLVADGKQPGYSTGLTNFELALEMMRLGCVTASALNNGAASVSFDAKLLNRPSRRGEPAVGDALTLFYYGVYAPPLSAKTFGRDDNVALSYKLVRPSMVTAELDGPSGVVIPIDSGQRASGTYRFNWTPGTRPQGDWTFHVAAQDDQGRTSVAERDFTLK